MRRSKPFYQSKVFWLNFVTFLVAAVAVLQTSPLFAGYGEVLTLIVALLNLGLRFVTDRPIHISDKETW